VWTIVLAVIFASVVWATVTAVLKGVPGCTPWRRSPKRNRPEPDVFASPDADLDPESDTGEPQGWN
jgi:hypothetical protein